ncbi:MAG: FAD-binding protein [Clostridia bacterium]
MLSYKNEPLAKYASFRTGGNGDLVLFPQNQDELVSALREHKDAIVLGNASNTLITDKGIRGTVIFTTEIKEISINKNEITAASGASLSALAAFAAKNLLSGLEFLYGIPGTVGGAIYMNAGAYGGEIGNFIKEVRIFSPEHGIITLNRSEMNFGYRQSILQEKK